MIRSNLINRSSLAIVAALGLTLAAATFASAATISSLTPVDVDTYGGPYTPGTWYAELRQTPTGNGGTASIVNLPGGVATGAPDADGAVTLTTSPASATGNNDKTAVTTYGNFGLASTLATASATYSYYKNPSPDNLAAAPAYRIQIYNPTGTGDNFGALVYEPYWNNAGGANPTPSTWHTENITGTQGLFWWNGGFEQPNTAGGPPLHTLAEWATIFTASDPVDFAGANIISYSVGLGSTNPGQTTYVDHVGLNTLTYSDNANFVTPEPATLAAAGSLASLALGRRRRARA